MHRFAQYNVQTLKKHQLPPRNAALNILDEFLFSLSVDPSRLSDQSPPLVRN